MKRTKGRGKNSIIIVILYYIIINSICGGRKKKDGSTWWSFWMVPCLPPGIQGTTCHHFRHFFLSRPIRSDGFKHVRCSRVEHADKCLRNNRHTLNLNHWVTPLLNLTVPLKRDRDRETSLVGGKQNAASSVVVLSGPRVKARRQQRGPLAILMFMVGPATTLAL